MINEVYGQNYDCEPECFEVNLEKALTDIVNELQISKEKAYQLLEITTIDDPIECVSSKVRYWNEDKTFAEFSQVSKDIARRIVRHSH